MEPAETPSKELAPGLPPTGATPGRTLVERALVVLSATALAIPALVEPLHADLLERSPAPGEWSPREILGHLLYVEGLLQERVRRMAEGPGEIEMPPGPPAPPPDPVEVSLERWRALRRETLAWLASLDQSQLGRIGIHRRYGRISVQEHVAEWAYHDLEHLRQLAAAIEADLYPGIGGWRALYPAPYG